MASQPQPVDARIAKIQQIYDSTSEQIDTQFWRGADKVIAERVAQIRENIAKNRKRLEVMKRPYPQDCEDADCRALTRAMARAPFKPYLKAAHDRFDEESLKAMAAVHIYFDIHIKQFEKLMAEGEEEYKRVLGLSRSTGEDYFGQAEFYRQPFTADVEKVRIVDVEESKGVALKDFGDYINEQLVQWQTKAAANTVAVLKKVKGFNYTRLGLGGRTVIAYCYADF